MQIVVDGLMTHYQKHGSGKVILLLHGWADRLETFNSLQPYFEDYTVVALDLPGFGQTQTPEIPWSLNEYAAFTRAFLDKIGIEDVYALCGHSNGGAIAVRGLAQGTLDAHKLILLASAGIRSEYKTRKKALRLVAKTAKAFTAPLPPGLKRRLKRKAYSLMGSEMFVAEDMQDTFKLIVQDDVQADAAKLNQPTLLIYGDQDVLTPLKQARLLTSRLQNARLEIIPGVGHSVHKVNPAQVGSLIQEFLK